jgi:uncharacterized repeat protein (TIGR03803 family)
MAKLNRWKVAYLVVLLRATTAIALPAQTFTTLHSFHQTDGTEPFAALVQGTNGDLCGTTYYGGANSEGTVFKITASGTLTTLLSFDGTEGSAPTGLVQTTDGNFYGTTYGGYGTVFKVTPSGTLTVLYSFCSQAGCTDGAYPFAALVQATNGDFYGTTAEGGANGYGTVFKITPSGTLTTLYSFCSQSNCTDGAGPNGLVQATNGNFYGTTGGGGSDNDGTVFRIAPSGTLTTLFSFNGTDGSGPNGLIQATDGNLYGTTVEGANNYGTVFKISASGALKTLYSFCSQSDCTDGEYPNGLIQATDGNFYGTAYHGGASGYGTVFKITPGGTLTTLHSFDHTDGAYPMAGLVQDTNGSFYGTTGQGGAIPAACGVYGCGTVFSLSVGLGPFVETLPTSGKVGAAVKILGTNLTGATSVTFNGTSATFTVVSSSEIKTSVPAGATTGGIKVVTPSGTLSSNLPFRVAP